MKLPKLGLFSPPSHYASFKERMGPFILFVAAISGLAHFGFIFLFMFAGVKEMMYFNIFISVPVLTLSVFLASRKIHIPAIIITYVEIVFHAFAAIHYIGWSSGFQFYLLTCAILVHLAYGWKRSVRLIIFAIFLILFIISYTYLRVDAIYQLNSILINVMYVFNVFVFTSIASIYIFYFVNVLVNYEKKIKLVNEKLNQKNTLINEQKDEIEAQRDSLAEQKNEIECIHAEVTDSIDYAKRIQTSILPDYTILPENLQGLFVFYRPKHAVSGDFYWWGHIEKHTVITAADCTGHGVPGAFMSMLGISFLREIVLKEYMTHPGVILRKLRKEIIKSLKQKGEYGEQKDGMDLALISINHEEKLIQFAGANNSAYIVSDKPVIAEGAEIREHTLDNFPKALYEIRPDKMPIGIYQKMDKFATHEFKLNKGDTIYLFSDGFADQFGGPSGKKFKYKPFKDLLLGNSDKPMFEQKEILKKAYDGWKGDYEQVDDVVVLGVQI